MHHNIVLYTNFSSSLLRPGCSTQKHQIPQTQQKNYSKSLCNLSLWWRLLMSDFLKEQRADWRCKKFAWFNVSSLQCKWKTTAEVDCFYLHRNLLAFPNKEEFLRITKFQKLTTVRTISNVSRSRSFFRHLNFKKNHKTKPKPKPHNLPVYCKLQSNPLEADLSLLSSSALCSSF